MRVSYALLVTGLATQQATATWNLLGNPFKSPKYNDNECSEKQRSGFDWSELKEGISNFEYSGFDFSGGWRCANSFNKRDHITKRTFGSKCIKNKIRKDKSASFSCKKRKSGFSIDYIDVSVEYDVSLDLHFTMGDGSLCRMLDVGCKTDGSSIKNTQCGGATSVEVYLGSRYKGEKKECEIGFHNIGFNCDKDKPYTTPAFQIPSSTVPIESQTVTTAPLTKTTTSCGGEDEDCSTQPPVTSGTTVPCNDESCKTQPASTAPPTETTVSYCEGGSCAQPPVSSGISPPCDGGSCKSQPPVSTTVAICDGDFCYSQPPVPTPTTETPPGSCDGESCDSQPPRTSASITACDGGFCYAQPPVTTGSVETVFKSSTVVEVSPVSSALIETSSISFSLIGSTPGSSVLVETLSVFSTQIETPPASQTTPSIETPEVPCYGSYGKECVTSVLTPPVSFGVIETPPASQTTPSIKTPAISCDGGDNEECITSFVTVTSKVTRQPSTLFTHIHVTSLAPVYSSPPDSPDTLVPPPASQSSIVPPQSESCVEVPPASSSGSTPPVLQSSSVSPSCYGGYGESCDGSTTSASSPPMSTNIPSAPSPPLSTGIPYPRYSNSTSPPSSSTGTPPSSNPPDVLPRCMNTWIQMDSTMQCKDNTDSNCYCKIRDFTKNVIDCVSAWCNNDDETKEALQYLIGICVDHVVENPGIVTDCPSYIPLAPTTPTACISTTAASASVVETPCTTITVGSIEVKVPQVHFATEANPTAPVGLVPGTAPAQTPAYTTAAPYPMVSTMATFAPSGTGAYTSSPPEFTGAASLFGVDVGRVVVGAVIALVAL